MPSRATPRGRVSFLILAGGILAFGLSGCQSGIGHDPARPAATIAAYETEVSDLQRRVDEQQATLSRLTPPPATPNPPPFDDEWRVTVAGRVEMRSTVGRRKGVTPVTAHGAFLVVPITTVNEAASPVAFSGVGPLVVVDEAGNSYEVDSRASGAAYLLDFGYDPSFGARQPGVRYPDVLVFDIPPDASGLTLESADGSFSVALTPVRVGTPRP